MPPPLPGSSGLFRRVRFELLNPPISATRPSSLRGQGKIGHPAGDLGLGGGAAEAGAGPVSALPTRGQDRGI